MNTWAVFFCKTIGTILRIDTKEWHKQIDYMTRNLMTMHKAIHPIDNTDYMCPEKKEGMELPTEKIANST